jgi:TonB family protein
MIFQWFNPVIWLIGREIRTVHEYLADEAVLKSGVSKPNYQQMILEESLGLRVNLLANHFNVSLIKSRIVMMTKSKSGLWAKGKVLFALPVVFLMMILFSSNSFSKTEPPQDVPKDKGTSPQANEAYKTVEKMPSFPGGDEARVNFMMKNLKYPEEAMKKNITGKVFVNFIVRADGSISSVKVLRGIGGGCDEEAVRVIRLMPKWNPGMDKGKPVDVQFTMPIVFMLDADKSKSGEKASKPDQNK